MALMSNRSIENHVEFVLSTYLKREQGQSGAHIWRPYTGAEKGKESTLADNCKNDGYDDNMIMLMIMKLMRYYTYTYVVEFMYGVSSV